MSRRTESPLHGDREEIASTLDLLTGALQHPICSAIDMEILVANYISDDEPAMAGLIDAIEQLARPRAATLLRAFALLARGRASEVATAASARTEAAGVQPEAQFAALGNAQPARAWVLADADDAEAVIVDFDYPGSRPHAFVTSFDWDRPGLVRQINFVAPVAERRARWPEAAGIPLAVARLLLEEPLGRPNPHGGRHGEKSYGPIMRSRLALLTAPDCTVGA